MTDHSMGAQDYVVVGGGAAGSVVAGELSKTGADVLLVESGGIDSAPTIGNPSTGAASFGHPVGTARIGTDPAAVVDSNLRVHNVRGLRIADASVMPTIPAGATNAPSIMIGGRAAKLIEAAGGSR